MTRRRPPTSVRPRQRPTTHAAWTRLVEAATLGRQPGSMAEAVATFRTLPPSEQSRLAQELVSTRRGEITRAYADVIAVSAGFRVRRDSTDTPQVEPEACVTLVVKHKRARWRVSTARRVPEAFFTHATVGDRRVLCAIPTDVQDGRGLQTIRALARVEAVAEGQQHNAPGAIACAVTRDDGVYAISCRHVISMSLNSSPPAVDASELRLVGDTASLATATVHAGALANHLDFSFDSQLARVTDLARLREALGDVTYAARALGWDDLPAGADSWILTPAGPVLARFARQHSEPVSYGGGLTDIRHRALALFLTPNDAPIAGDSGSPVMSARGGGKLLGMLVAGDERSYALAIPAWQLLLPDAYGLTEGPWGLWPPS